MSGPAIIIPSLSLSIARNPLAITFSTVGGEDIEIVDKKVIRMLVHSQSSLMRQGGARKEDSSGMETMESISIALKSVVKKGRSKKEMDCYGRMKEN